jgi:negative regulator of flagellin synthesis FlgM
MKIGSFDNANKPIPPTANGQAPATAFGKPTAAEPEASAKVALSPAAATGVDEAKADFDAERVSRIAQAIRDGKFKVNAEAIADKLIANTRELLARPGH